MVKLRMGLVDPVPFGGVSISLVHCGVFVRRSCCEEAIYVSPSVFCRIRSKNGRRDHGGLTCLVIRYLISLIIYFHKMKWLVTPN